MVGGVMLFASLALLVAVLSVPSTNGEETLKVTTILDSPYVIKKDDGTFDGFSIDVLKDIAKTLNVKVEIKVAKDERYGTEKDGKWTGMVGELISKEADVAAAALTVTNKRKAVIDFSKSLTTSGLTIMMNRETVFGKDKSAYNLSYFLNPFSIGVWLLLPLCLFLVSIFIALMNRFNPYEYGARREEGQLPPGVTGNLGFRESLLFCFSALTLQGYQRPPLSLAARVMATFWWFFSIILVCTYVANLVQVTQEANTITNPKFTNLDDVMDSDLKLGIMKGGATQGLFSTTTNERFHKAWVKMSSDPNNLASSMNDAVERISEGGHAYILEQPYVDYITSKNCSFVMVGRKLISGEHAFGFQKGSAYKEKFEKAIEDLNKGGELEKYHEKWWHGGNKCPRSKVTDDMVDPRLSSGRGPVIPLTLTQFLGPILLLVIGLFMSIIIFICEVLYYSTVWNRNQDTSSKSTAKA